MLIYVFKILGQQFLLKKKKMCVCERRGGRGLRGERMILGKGDCSSHWPAVGQLKSKPSKFRSCNSHMEKLERKTEESCYQLRKTKVTGLLALLKRGFVFFLPLYTWVRRAHFAE